MIPGVGSEPVEVVSANSEAQIGVAFKKSFLHCHQSRFCIVYGKRRHGDGCGWDIPVARRAAQLRQEPFRVCAAAAADIGPRQKAERQESSRPVPLFLFEQRDALFMPFQ